MACSFGGTSNFLSIGNPASLRITDDITFAAFVKVRASTSQSVIAGRHDSIIDNIQFNINTDAKFFVYSDFAGGSLVSNTALTTSTSWYHVAFSRVGTACAFYLNGVSDGTGQYLLNFGTVQNNWTISSGTGDACTLDIDEVAIWNTGLSASDIGILGTTRVKGTPMRVSSTALISYWPMTEAANGVSGNGITFVDRQSGNNATGAGSTFTGVQFTRISYLLANDKNHGLGRGLFHGGIS